MLFLFKYFGRLALSLRYYYTDLILAAFHVRKVIQHAHQSSRISSSEMISSIGRTSFPLELEPTRGNDKSNAFAVAAGLGLGLINGAP